jgi:hypothetical protein
VTARFPIPFQVRAVFSQATEVDLKPGDPEPFPDVRGFAKVAPESAAQ